MKDPSKKTRPCERCQKPLPDSRRNRRFCSAACRFRAWQETKGVSSEACTYCGVKSDVMDHVPARAVRQVLREQCPGRYVELEVRACTECNSAIGAKGFTVAQRKEIAKRAIEKRYRHYLSHPHWTAEDLVEMGPFMRSDIAGAEVLKLWVLRRLQW